MAARVKGRQAFTILASGVFLLALSCAHTLMPPGMVPPALPPAYYDCIEADPQRLVDAYYAPYVDINEAQRLYSGSIFVFKNIELNEAMTRDAGDGYIWAGGSVIKCYCLNIEDLVYFKPGDRLDIVGVNLGIGEGSSVLTFADCYLMPAGSLKLPVEPSVSIPAGY
jgi:hypothetical protein